MKRRETQSKTEILEVLKTSKSALSHDMIQENINSTIDRATIYRVLNRFCEDGKVHKIVGDDGKQYFAICQDCEEKKEVHSHKHIHFRCLECGKVECLETNISAQIPHNYVAKIYNLVISGLCNKCNLIV